jgi:hypothetical protein
MNGETKSASIAGFHEEKRESKRVYEVETRCNRWISLLLNHRTCLVPLPAP